MKTVDRTGYVEAVDGGRIYVSSSHKALNSLLQSMGALIAKKWVLQFEQNLLNRGLKHGWDGNFVFLAFLHDEGQIAFKANNINLELYEDPNDYSGMDEKKAKKLKSEHKQQWIKDNCEVARILAEEVENAIKQTQEHFDIKIPLECAWVFGKNWADTH